MAIPIRELRRKVKTREVQPRLYIESSKLKLLVKNQRALKVADCVVISYEGVLAQWHQSHPKKKQLVGRQGIAQLIESLWDKAYVVVLMSTQSEQKLQVQLESLRALQIDYILQIKD